MRRTESGCSWRTDCFNPRTRRACDDINKQEEQFSNVSIHARAERATSFLPTRMSVSSFQSTHAQSVRLRIRKLYSRLFSFNPRTRRACDSLYQGLNQAFFCFNPRTRRACDALGNIHYHDGKLFQSTHAQSVRQYYRLYHSHFTGFNPRTRRACDEFWRASNRVKQCFNPRTRRACDVFCNRCA